MRVLVVGGTGFLGKAIADAARAAGHDVTTLSRRALKRNHISADRTAPLPDLRQHAFDWVFDSCAYTPAMVNHVLDAVGPDISHYCMISSVSAFSDIHSAGTTETGAARKATPQELALEVPNGSRTDAIAYGPAYGPLKRSCELAATDRIGDRAHLVRVGLLVGPGDYTDRLTWWVRRIDQGGTVPVPLPETAALQVIDARDAAAYCIEAAERGDQGVISLTGPERPLSQVLAHITTLTGQRTRLEWLPHTSFANNDVAYWTDIPLVLSPDWHALSGMLSIDTGLAISRGLRLRPITITLADILVWDRGRRDKPLSCGMTPAQEAALLA